MLPVELFQFLRTPISRLSGVGEARLVLFNKLLCKQGNPHARMVDIIAHRPLKVLQRRAVKQLSDSNFGETIIATAVVEEHLFPPAKSRAPIRVVVGDGSESIILSFFGGDRRRIQSQLPIGARKLIMGDVEMWNGHKQIHHPTILQAIEATLPEQEVVYPLTAGLFNGHVRRVVGQVLAPLNGQAIAEWIAPSLLESKHWPPFVDAMHTLHNAQDVLEESAALTRARQRLAYDELLGYQIGIALMRRTVVANKGESNVGAGHLRAGLRNALPYTLTGAQERAIAQILADMAAPTRMLQLLQGDVGSGKTIVALFAILAAIETGGQAALMAPTDILARQHAATLEKLLTPLGIEVGILTGRDKGASRARTLRRLAGGELQLVVGTHALFQEAVQFRDLRLAVIDEQHKFGVTQRMELARKGANIDMLVMSATPIPRTLVLTLYGDMDVCVLDEKPVGRLPIKTAAMPTQRMDEIIAALQRTLADGRQIYWVCPLVAESELIDLAAAKDRAAHLQGVFGAIVGLVHGQMPADERDIVMAAFKAGSIKILVATTVIEVGVDVPNASVMVIEHAERFGLAQLHQVRGRVGRGAAQSSCILLYKEPLSPTARARLSIMRQSNDGFIIAEEDLRLRGPGEMLGVKQSGLPEFLFANLETDQALLAAAKDQATMMLASDPRLETPTGLLMRELLRLFQKDIALGYIGAG